MLIHLPYSQTSYNSFVICFSLCNGVRFNGEMQTILLVQKPYWQDIMVLPWTSQKIISLLWNYTCDNRLYRYNELFFETLNGARLKHTLVEIIAKEVYIYDYSSSNSDNANEALSHLNDVIWTTTKHRTELKPLSGFQGTRYCRAHWIIIIRW